MPQINDLSPAWLTEVLQSESVIGSEVLIDSYESHVLTGGLMADTLRLTLQYANGNGTEPTSIIGKFPSSNPDSRAAGHEMASYSKEVNFYKHLAEQLSMRTPRCYYASIDEETSDFALILEDLAPAIVADSTIENAKELLLLSFSELALLHGETQGQDNIKPYAMHGEMSNEQMAGAASAGWAILKRVADDRLPAASIAAGDKLLQNIEKLHSFKGLRTCLVHGDYRFPNILYREGNEAITVDWQTYQWSTPGIDLAHGVICSLDLDQARDFYEECLNHYHQEIVSVGVKDYSINDCYYDFKVGLLFDMQMMMLTTFGVGSTHLSDAARDQILDGCQRIWTLADELNVLEILE